MADPVLQAVATSTSTQAQNDLAAAAAALAAYNDPAAVATRASQASAVRALAATELGNVLVAVQSVFPAVTGVLDPGAVGDPTNLVLGLNGCIQVTLKGWNGAPVYRITHTAPDGNLVASAAGKKGGGKGLVTYALVRAFTFHPELVG